MQSNDKEHIDTINARLKTCNTGSEHTHNKIKWRVLMLCEKLTKYDNIVLHLQTPTKDTVAL